MQITKIKLNLTVFIILFLFSSCNIDNKYRWRNRAVKHYQELIPYDLLRPVTKMSLNEDLIEISGLVHIGNNEIACIEDESGHIYILDDSTGEVKKDMKFHKHGDYEGITRLENAYYVVKSNGHIYKWENDMLDDYHTELSSKNNVEGLCYNPAGDELLLVCKEEGGIENDLEDMKAVYSYDYHKNKLNTKPKFLINEKTVNDYVRKQWGTGEEIPDLFFKPSGIAVNPLDSRIYIINYIGKLLIILEPNGDLYTVLPLSLQFFSQPEGICFNDQGDLFIASEGGEENGYILKFNLRELED